MSNEGSKSSFFAPPERATAPELEEQIKLAASNVVIDAALERFGGLLAVLNKHRQVVALNTRLLDKLGVEDPQAALGLRPGEVLACAHAHEHDAGCGTAKACRSCGAVIAILDCMNSDESLERECVITTRQGDITSDLSFRLHLTPVTCCDERFVLIFLEDITEDKRRSTLERAFFHDIQNIIHALCGASTMFFSGDIGLSTEYGLLITELSDRLAKEVQIQRVLTSSKRDSYPIRLMSLKVARVFASLDHLFSSHPARSQKSLRFAVVEPGLEINTDSSLLLRILTNMITNALEASELGGEVIVDVSSTAQELCFEVHNEKPIPEEISERIFERHFTTKGGVGRGTGTFSMKLFGESFLGGTVGFRSLSDGTTFWFRHPR